MNVYEPALRETAGSGSPGTSCLAAFPAPGSRFTPARDLTPRDARDVVIYLIQQGAFTLRQSWSPVRFGARCTVVSPGPGTRITIQPAVIDAVRWLNYASGRPSGVFLDNLDMRLAIVLFRLSHLLRTRWGVSEIHHLGVGHGNPRHPRDCHNTGRALDFSGVAGVWQGRPYRLSVLRDWGMKPVTMPDGSIRSDWPAQNFARLSYRLRPLAGPDALLAFNIFRDVYGFAARECTDRSTRPLGNATPTSIGERGFILHPDTPTLSYRRQHRNHIHMQIGPTVSP